MTSLPLNFSTTSLPKILKAYIGSNGPESTVVPTDLIFHAYNKNLNYCEAAKELSESVKTLELSSFKVEVLGEHTVLYKCYATRCQQFF